MKIYTHKQGRHNNEFETETSAKKEITSCLSSIFFSVLNPSEHA